MKKCSKCGVEKELSDFGKAGRGDKLRADCKECFSKQARLKYHRDPVAAVARVTMYVRENRERVLARKSELNKKYWSRLSPDQKLEASRKARPRAAKWSSNNKDKVAAYSSFRRARLLDATPSWVDDQHKRTIEEIYTTAKCLSEYYGTPYHVDHIEPLKGINSSGLHVWWNLRAIPATDNCRKRNKLIT